MTKPHQPDAGPMADVASERALLGSVFIDNRAWDKVALVPKEGWSLESHLRIRMGMKRLVSAGAVITVSALAASLAARNELDVIGGKQYLVSLREHATQRPSADDSDYVMPDDAPEPPPTREPATSSARGTHSGRQKIPDLTLDQGMPCNVEAERTILGAILLDNAAHAEAAEKLKSEDFSLDSHRRIFLRMTELMNAERAVDIVTLANELNRYKEVESIGGVAYLASLTEGLPRRPVIDEYIRIVKDKSLLRQTMGICSMAIARAADQSESALEVLSVLQKKLEEIAAPVAGSQDSAIQNFIVEAIADIDHEYQTKSSPCIPTGIAWLDSATGGGLRHGNIFLICARPNVGKTPAILQMMVHNLQRGMKCVLFSLEKPKKAILRDLIPHVVDIPNRVVHNAWMQTPEQNRLIHEAAEIIAGWELKIYDGKMDGDQICYAIKRESKNDEEVLYGLDHGGMVQGRRGEDPVERDNYISGSIRDTIKHTRSAIAILRQLRKVKREFAESAPVPDDVKGSGNLWEDAFGALIIHRAINPETRKMSLEALMNLAKLRTGGSTGSTKGTFNPRILRFDADAEFEYDNQANDWHQ